MLVQQVTIVGLGLIGGSLGMALRRRGVAARVVGVSRKPSTLAEAQRRGAIDAGTRDAREAAQSADVVVLATPVDAIVPEGRRLLPVMRAGSILTDAGSTKQQIVDGLAGCRPDVAFVGAHPLAGSEQRGIASARADLFDGAACVVTSDRRTPRAAEQRIARLWRAIGCRVVRLDPRTHDRCLAAVSHLPHTLAYSLMSATPSEALRLAPRSFLEATRVANSDPDLWDDIFLSNATAVLDAMDRFERPWQQMRRMIRQGDRAGLRRWLAAARRRRVGLDDR